jgi:hypothetical protein
MIFKETILKATQIDEMMSYLAGKHDSSVKKIEAWKRNSNDHFPIDASDVTEMKLAELKVESIDLQLENGKEFSINIDWLSPGLVHFVLDTSNDTSDENFEYISGVV